MAKFRNQLIRTRHYTGTLITLFSSRRVNRQQSYTCFIKYRHWFLTIPQQPSTSGTKHSLSERSTDDSSGERLTDVAKVEFATGCFVVLLFIASVALWIYLCFKGRAVRNQLKVLSSSVTVERNSQSVYESIPENYDWPVAQGAQRLVPSIYRLQGRRIYIPPDIRHSNGVTDFVHNPAYRDTRLAGGQLLQQQGNININQNPAYQSSQGRLEC